MISVANQFRRIFADDGRGDKDYSAQEERLREAHKALSDATDELTKASQVLTEVLRSKGILH